MNDLEITPYKRLRGMTTRSELIQKLGRRSLYIVPDVLRTTSSRSLPFCRRNTLLSFFCSSMTIYPLLSWICQTSRGPWSLEHYARTVMMSSPKHFMRVSRCATERKQKNGTQVDDLLRASVQAYWEGFDEVLRRIPQIRTPSGTRSTASNHIEFRVLLKGGSGKAHIDTATLFLPD